MGAVYKVRLPIVGKIMALKLLAPQPALVTLLGWEEIHKRFIFEARTMGRLRHPNIAALWDYQDGPEQTFIVMEYFCRNLGAIIGEAYHLEEPSRAAGVDRAVDYIGQTLQGLARLHQAGLVHRDIKPFNLLISDENVIKITDFGLSRLRGENWDGPSKLRVGTPYYTAPEQERDPDSAGPRADLYSVGVTFFRLLTGYLPLDPKQKAADLNPELDDLWDSFFQTALEPDPVKRFADAREMSAELARLKAAWDEQTSFCRIDPDPPARPPDQVIKLRRDPLKVRPYEAEATFGTDALGRPRDYSRREFTPLENQMVYEAASGLTWQKSGSDFMLTKTEALEYVAELNRIQWAGAGDWRLPTVDELLTLLALPARTGDPCLEPIFDQSQNTLWSADTRSALAGWYIHTELGFADRQDFTCLSFARAVRG